MTFSQDSNIDIIQHKLKKYPSRYFQRVVNSDDLTYEQIQTMKTYLDVERYGPAIHKFILESTFNVDLRKEGKEFVEDFIDQEQVHRNFKLITLYELDNAERNVRFHYEQEFKEINEVNQTKRKQIIELFWKQKAVQFIKLFNLYKYYLSEDTWDLSDEQLKLFEVFYNSRSSKTETNMVPIKPIICKSSDQKRSVLIKQINKLLKLFGFQIQTISHTNSHGKKIVAFLPYEKYKILTQTK